MSRVTNPNTIAGVSGIPTRKTVAFSGAAGNGAVGAVNLFTVTGSVLIRRITARCTEDLAGATATLALGVTGSTALFIAATTATDIDTGEFWLSTTPAATGLALPAALQNIVVDADIILTVATANITDGTIEFTVEWTPLSSDGNLVAA